MKISVIVPIYNIAKFLEQCVDSILCQDISDMEVILIDDGSTDESGLICDVYSKKDDRVRVIHQENQGLVNARKRGISEATGEYIAFVDGDDWLEPDGLSYMLDEMDEHKPDVIIASHYVDTADDEKVAGRTIPAGVYCNKEIDEYIFPNMIVGDTFFDWGIYASFWAKVFRKDLLKPLLMEEDERLVMGEDAACVYPYLSLCNHIIVSDKCVYHYRQTPFSMVKVNVERELERIRYRALYESGMKYFEANKERYDFTSSWRKYVIFLMTPRMDILYDDFDKEDFLIPFTRVKRGMKIVLYGAGTYGQRLYAAIMKSGICDITHWVDRNYIALSNLGLDVEAPDTLIGSSDFDAIVIANTYYKSRMGLYNMLLEKYPKEMIHMIDEKWIVSEDTMRACGLL